MEEGVLFFTILLYGVAIIYPICYGISEMKNRKKFTTEGGKRIDLSYATITTKTDSSLACASLCTSDVDCVTASYDNSTKQCLLNTDCIPIAEKWQNAVLIRIANRPTDCGDLDKSTSNSGLYKIFTEFFLCFKVFCEMEKHGGGWTVFQRRMNGETNFYRDWNAYKQGFGDLRQEFWLGVQSKSRDGYTHTGSNKRADRLKGNDYLHLLTSQGHYRLRIDMEDFDNNKTYALYHHFSIGGESSGYILSVSGYSGDAGDSMTFQNGQKFSTKDRDNDIWGNDCAEESKGAWWYSTCHYSNLNGLYLEGYMNDSYADGVIWQTWKGFRYSLKETIMMIRKV